MKTNDLVKMYMNERFFIIPLQKNSKVPIYKKWNERPLEYEGIHKYLNDGYNIGIVGGYQSRKWDLDLCILDFDRGSRGPFSGPISLNIEHYRKFNTYVQFTPHGFHVFLRMKELDSDKIEKYLKSLDLDLSLRDVHRSTINPHHEDNTFDGMEKKEHDEYFVESIRWNSMYVVACPSKVNGKSYWFLDDCKGEILEL